MTGGVNRGGRRRTWLGTIGVSPRGAPQGRSPNWTRGGVRPPFPSPPPSPSPFPPPIKGRGANWTRSPSGTPPTWGAPRPASSPLPPLYTGVGAPLTHINCSKPCAAPPSSVCSSGHIIVVLRRSPARITSPSPSPCRRADETLPRHVAGSRVRGTSSS